MDDSNIIPEEGTQRPSLRFLNRYVRDSVGLKWHDLGIELLDSNDVDKLDIIDSEYPSDHGKCCTELFKLWLRKQPSASWNQLIEALKQPDIELGVLATKIEGMLLQGALKGPVTTTAMEDLSIEFSALLADIASMLNDSPASLSRFKINYLNITTLSTEDTMDIQDCESGYEIFYQLRHQWKWDSHRLLYILLKRSGPSYAVYKLEQFQNKVDYTKRLNEYFQSLHKSYPPDYARIKAIIKKDYSEFTSDDCEELDRYLSSANTVSLDLPFHVVKELEFDPQTSDDNSNDVLFDEITSTARKKRKLELSKPGNLLRKFKEKCLTIHGNNTLETLLQQFTNDFTFVVQNYKQKDMIIVTQNISKVFQHYLLHTSVTMVLDGFILAELTMVCKSVVNNWANGMLLQYKDVVLYISHCDSSTSSLTDIFMNVFDYDDYSAQILSEYFVNVNGKGLLLIFDHVETSCEFNDFFSDILNRVTLQECTLLIVSHPDWFSKNYSDDYLKIELVSDFEPSVFINLLKLLEKYTCLSLTSDPIKLNVKDFEKDTSSFDSLPSKYEAIIEELSLFSFKALKFDKFSFSKFEVNIGLSSAETFLKGNSILRESDVKNSYEFAHVYLQEYLAAYYIFLLSEDKQIAVLNEIIWNKTYRGLCSIYISICAKNSSNCFQHYISIFMNSLNSSATISIQDKERLLVLLHLLSRAPINVVTEILKTNRTLDLNGLILSYGDIQAISHCLMKLNEIYTLNLSGCFIDDQKFSFFIKNLLQNHGCKIMQRPSIHTVNLSHNKLTSLSIDRLSRLTEVSKIETLKVSDDCLSDSRITGFVESSSILTTLDLSGNQIDLTEMIRIAQLLRENVRLQKLNICNNAETFCTDTEFIIDVILSVNSKISEGIIGDTNIRSRFSNYSKILSNNVSKSFSLQHLYIANKFPLYLSRSYMFEENFITSIDGNKKEVKEKCPLDDTIIFTHYVDHKGGVYYYKDHDISLFIPPGAILQDEWVEIKVSSSFYGQFHMSENYNRISSYVWVGANYDFKVPVYLIINHFVNMKSVKNIKALTAFEVCKLYSSSETVTMQEISTSYFDTDLKYCVISTDHFCTYCLAELQTSSHKEYNSHKEFLAIYYNYENVKPNKGITYIAEICCLYFNNNCYKNIKEQFDGIKPEYSKDFSMHNKQHLGLEFEEPEPSSEWSVTVNQQKITYEEFNFQRYSNNVDLLKCKEELHIYPPRFKLWCFKNKTESITSFNRTLSLKLMESSNIVKKIYDVPFPIGPAVGDIDQVAVRSPSSLASSEPCQSETTTKIMNTRPEMWDVIKIVFPKIRGEWKYVAYSMRYTPHDVKTFEIDSHDSEGSCFNLFTDWLATDHGITPKTWHKLIERIKAVDKLQNAAESIEDEVKKL